MNVEEYFKDKTKQYASILEWANKVIDFAPQDSKHKMHGCLFRDDGNPGAYYGVSSDGKTTVHINEVALYEQCKSPHCDDPDFWIAHEKAGNPFIDTRPYEPGDLQPEGVYDW